MKEKIKSPFDSMTPAEQRAFFEADADTERHGKNMLKKERKANLSLHKDKKAS